MDRNDRTLQWVIKYGIAFSMGVAAGVVGAMKQIHPVARFELDWIAGVSFVVMTGVVALGWDWVFGAGKSLSGPVRRRRLIGVTVALALATMGACAFSLKGLSQSKQFEIALGSLTGLGVCLFVLFVVLRLAKALEDDHRSVVEEQERREEE